MFTSPAYLNNNLVIDREAEKWCLDHGLRPYIGELDQKIFSLFQNVIMIKHKLVEDNDIPEKGRLVFEIHLSEDPYKILEKERELHSFLFDQVPEGKQHLLLFTYRMPSPS